MRITTNGGGVLLEREGELAGAVQRGLKTLSAMRRAPVTIELAVCCVIILVGPLLRADDEGSRKDPASRFPVLSGIGVALSITEKGAEIHKVLPGSAAEKCGKLKEGDCIVAIRNGDRTINVIGKPLGDVVSLIRGPVGTTVTLEIRSGKLGTSSLVTVKREAVPIPALSKNLTYDELIGKPAPAIEFSTLDQKSQVALSKYKGKAVIIDFWASWCGTCFAPVDKMQEIARAHPEYGDRVVLLAATIDTDLRSATKVIEARKWQRTTHVALAPEKLETIQIATVPAMMIISPEGKIAAVGDPHAIAIEKEIDKLLARETTDRPSEKPKYVPMRFHRLHCIFG